MVHNPHDIFIICVLEKAQEAAQLLFRMDM